MSGRKCRLDFFTTEVWGEFYSSPSPLTSIPVTLSEPVGGAEDFRPHRLIERAVHVRAATKEPLVLCVRVALVALRPLVEEIGDADLDALERSRALRRIAPIAIHDEDELIEEVRPKAQPGVSRG